MNVKSKICLQCGKEFLRDFEKYPETLIGIYHWRIKKYCSKECKHNNDNEKRNLWRKENKEEYHKESKEYYQKVKNSKELNDKHLKSLHKHQQSIKGKLTSYKSGAKQRGLEFSLTKEQFESYWKKPCFYCGDKIETIGLDRIDNSKGYTLDNIVPCCKTCNNMKKDLSQEEFISQCKKIIMKGSSL